MEYLVREIKRKRSIELTWTRTSNGMQMLDFLSPVRMFMNSFIGELPVPSRFMTASLTDKDLSMLDIPHEKASGRN